MRNGRRALAEALAGAKRLDEIRVESAIKGVKEEVEGMIGELLFTDVMRSVLCSEDDFAFAGKNTKVFARLNRAELGDFDALVIGLFLISQFKGQVIIPDFGFYGREHHIALIRQNRLIAGVNTLSELPVKVQQALLTVPKKVASRATYEDAETLARYEGLIPRTIAHNDFIAGAMAA